MSNSIPQKAHSRNRGALLAAVWIAAVFLWVLLGLRLHSMSEPSAITERGSVSAAPLRADSSGQDTTTVPAIGSSARSGTNAGTKEPGCIDVNTAGVDALQALPGIGPVLAQRILEYRTENGAFESADALVEVKGIGEKKLEKLRTRVCF